MRQYKPTYLSRHVSCNLDKSMFPYPIVNHLATCAPFIQQLLILLAGDVEPNPGPAPNHNNHATSSDPYIQLTNNGLSIMHLNIQSLKPKIDLLAIEAQPYDILVFTETWLSSSTTNDELHIPNFNPPFRLDRINRPGGGVAIYTRNTIHAIERQDLTQQDLEALWVEVRVSQRKLLIGGIYRPPDANNTQWLNMEHSIDLAFNQHFDNIIVTGDFNINVSASPNNRMDRLIDSYNAHQLITSPTHFTEHSRTTIDLIFVKNHQHVLHSFVAAPFIPDLIRFHCPIVSVFKFSKPIQSSFKRHIWLYDKGDYPTYRNLLQSTDWASILANNDMNSIAINIADSITSAASKSIPNKTVIIRSTDVPWMNNNIRQMIKKRNKIHQTAKSTNTESSWEEFRRIRNATTSIIRKSKAEHQSKIIKQINTENIQTKTWFKLANKLNNKKSKSSVIPTLFHNGIEASSDADKAELLNSFFCSQSTLDDGNHPIPTIHNHPLSSLSEISISTTDVKDAISLVNPSKASGPDKISPRLIKEGSEELAGPLAHYYNLILSNSTFPLSWKQANVTPIFKKSDPSTPSNYRPISLLNCLGKLMERCIHKQIYNYVTSNNLLTSFQSGFIKGDSTVNLLTYLYNDICKALDEGKEVRAVFCDISKAFDRVWHRGLLHKLSSIGISGPLLSWFESYLSNRKQRVVYANTTSAWSSVNAGVPQGSILGPLLFLIYINDIVTDVEAKIRLFADDTSLYVIVDDPASSATLLNRDLARIHSWSESWLVTFNPNKTESVLFSRKRHKLPHPILSMDQNPIKQVKSHKHLGLTFSDDGTWTSHISSSLNKAWQRIGILRSLKSLLSRSSLERMYVSFIRPLLEYADVVWDNCSNTISNDIEAVHNEAARIVSGATKLCNLDRLRNDLNWETLAARRKTHRCIIFFKMRNNLTPAYLSDIIPPQPIQTYSLRSVPDVPLIHTKTQAYAQSFLPATIRDWNSLPHDTRNSITVSEFKSKLSKPKKNSPLYNLGTRRLQILHAQLRLGCSSLNFDLHRKNIVESPYCACGAVETTIYYLMQCTRYNDARRLHLSHLPCALTTNNLLYGDERLPFNSNKSVYLTVQAYIAATRRFDA